MKTLLSLVLLIVLTGCVHTEITLPDKGGKFSRTSFLSNQTVGNVTVKLEGADKGVKIDNYGQNGTDVATAALTLAEAVLKAAPKTP